MIHPDHPGKHLWDLLVVAVVAITGVVVPIRLAYGPEALASPALEVAITLIFGVDVLLSFRTARLVRGRVDDEPGSVARAYLRGWFTVDLVSALPVHALVSAAMGGGAPRALLLLRMARFLKLPALRERAQRWEAAHLVDPNAMRLALLLAGVLFLSHWVACGWVVVQGAETPARYVEALYWSVTTLTTVGYGDITPAADSARIYTMFVMFLGVAMWATIIGSIASLIRGLDHARIEHNERMDRINDFMRYHELPASLQRRIRDHFHYLWSSRRGIDERELSDELPRHLRGEVALHLLREMLASVPILREASPELLRRLAERLEPQAYAPGEWIVRRGELGDCMYFVDRGAVEVLGEAEEVQARLGPGSFFGELALLAGDRRRSMSVRAADYCDLYALDRADFEAKLREFPEFATRVQQAADRHATRPEAVRAP